MLTEKQMDTIAEKYISVKFRGRDSYQVIVLFEYTVKKKYGNIYFYNDKRFIEDENKNYMHALAGNAPFLVEKETGRIVIFGTAHNLEYYINAYEKSALPPTLDRYWYPEEERYDYK